MVCKCFLSHLFIQKFQQHRLMILFSHSISCGNTSLRFGIDKVIWLNNMYFAFQACMPFFAKNIGINSLFCQNTPRKFWLCLILFTKSRSLPFPSRKFSTFAQEGNNTGEVFLYSNLYWSTCLYTDILSLTKHNLETLKALFKWSW